MSVTIELGEKCAGLLEKLTAQSGADARSVVEAALEMYAESALPDLELPPLSAEEEAAIRASLSDIEEGRVVPHEQVVAKVLAKFER